MNIRDYFHIKQIIKEISNHIDIIDTKENPIDPKKHPIIKLARQALNLRFNYETYNNLMLDYYYCNPEDMYSLDDPRKNYIGCPECGHPSDYCLDHKHWQCDICDNDIEETENKYGRRIYSCPTCESCEICGDPTDPNNCPTCKKIEGYDYHEAIRINWEKSQE